MKIPKSTKTTLPQKILLLSFSVFLTLALLVLAGHFIKIRGKSINEKIYLNTWVFKNNHWPARIGIYQSDTMYGWRHIPLSKGRHRVPFTFDVSYSIDSLGNRATPGGYKLPKVLFLGCSFTFGHGVENGETYSALLAKQFPSFKMVNAATNTWSPLPDFPAATHALKGAAIGDKIYLAGGYHDFLERDEVYIFDTQTEEYSLGTPLPLGRSYHNMVALDSCIYVVGGNHAIDETVRTQLIRFCPFETASAAREKGPSPSLTAQYLSGKLLVQLPADFAGTASLSLYNMAGRQVFFEKLSSGNGVNCEAWVGNLPPSVYLVQLRTERTVFTGKVAVN